MLVVAIAAAAVAGAAARAEAAFPGGNGLIAFTGTNGCPGDQAAVGLIGPDGHDMRIVTGCDDIWWTSDWSPDGTSLLYSNRHEIRLLDAGTLTSRYITRGRAPSFAPDGEHFTYRRALHDRELWRARVDGSQTRLLRARERFVGPPLWSPGGRTIAYHHYDVGTWLVSARTGKRIRTLIGPRLYPVDWSPDGRKLLCTRQAPEGRDGELYVVRADGKGAPRQVTHTPRRSEGTAAWSPDGHRFVVLVDTFPEAGYFRRAMVTMSTKGTDRHVLWRTAPLRDDAPVDQSINLPQSVKWQPLP